MKSKNMKKHLTLSLLLVAALWASAQQAAPRWTSILSDQPETYRTQLISNAENSIQVNVQVPGFYTASVTTPRGEAQVITLPKAVSTMTGIPVLIGDKARMSIRVIDAQYMDFEGIEVAPSKGDFPRTINPEDVPYTYGACYSEDAFFPASNIGLYEPYIIRDFRGQNMVVYPFAYNPATKTLRVYYNMTVEMYKVDDHGENVIESRRSNVVKMDADFKSGCFAFFLDLGIDFALCLLYHLLDPGGMDTAVYDQSFKSNAGNFSPDRIETGNDHRLGSIVDDQVHARHGLQSTDVSAFTSDDPALHFVAGQLDYRNGCFCHMIGGTALDGADNDFAGSLFRFLFCRRFRFLDHDGGIVFDVVFNNF